MGSGSSCWDCDGPMVVYHRHPSHNARKPKHESAHAKDSSWMQTAQDVVPNHSDRQQLPRPNCFPHGHRENPLLAVGSEDPSGDPHYYSALLAEESHRGDVGGDNVQSPVASGDNVFDLYSVDGGANATRDGGSNAVGGSSFRGSCVSDKRTSFASSSCSAEAMLAPNLPERLSAEIGSSGSGHHQRQQHIPRSPGFNRPGDSAASQPTATSSQTRVTFLDDFIAGEGNGNVHASTSSRLSVQSAAVRRVSSQIPSVVFLNDLLLAADVSEF